MGIVPLTSATPARDWHAIATALETDAQNWQRRIDGLVGPEPEHIRAYRRAFAADLGSATLTERLTRAECLKRVAQHDLVFCADVHTVPSAQRTCAAVLEAVASQDARPTALVLEIAMTEQQPLLDAFARGELNATTLLERLDWGFPAAGYADLLDTARRLGVRLIAANSRGSLAERDSAAAAVIGETLRKAPTQKLVVLFGQLHIGQSHLPEACEQALAAAGLRRACAWVVGGDHPSYIEAIRDGHPALAATLSRPNCYGIYATPKRRGLKATYAYLLDRSDF